MSRNVYYWWTALVAILATVGPPLLCDGLKVTGFRVPSLALYGSDVELDCAFSAARNAKLYSVKWYQNHEEFYRYMFAERTPVTAFTRPGINVDLARSNNSRVTLKSVNFNSSATFRCEVSADEPDFETVYRRANMTVIQVSEDGPLINGLRDQYELNEQLNVNCTSPSITPSIGSHQTKLSWQLNRQTVEGQTVQMQSSDPSQTVINLRLILTDRHFDAKTGLLRLNCSLAVGRPSSAVYFNRSLELSAALMHPTTVLDPRPTQRSSKSGKDSRSASYSSGGRRQFRLSLVTFLAVIPYALWTWCCC
ncbi:uncharacterized protein LOC124314604 [Daphnia pulicaria]|uniref:uncharacterized protein LOC124314604 n=1 Tax=Daphnia pulicaria TaxID=35523 RepID=UPI001EEBFC29|nr:uncharacterized protein LOC124314604 [Daphnia pulicaria]